MQIHNNANLKAFHTFATDITCDILVLATTLEDLISIYQNPEWENIPKLLLGKGSNVLFTEHFSGLVIINRILGIEVEETELDWLLHVNSGEDWPKLVNWSMENGYYGLENLALIPGCAGSAPIQNIGAYGVEFKDVCRYVDVLSLDTFKVSRLPNQECLFGYRDSVFKHELYGKLAIVAVGLKLSKSWKPVTTYGSLNAIPQNQLTAIRVYNEVCDIRMSKLPDPNVIGNAGSFFKNPIISVEQFQKLKNTFPDVVGFPDGNSVKIAAGWLIEQCNLKGVSIGGASVHKQQALVIVNNNDATPMDIVKLAEKVRATVYEKYRISLEHEVRFFDATVETYLYKIAGKPNERS